MAPFTNSRSRAFTKKKVQTSLRRIVHTMVHFIVLDIILKNSWQKFRGIHTMCAMPTFIIHASLQCMLLCNSKSKESFAAAANIISHNIIRTPPNLERLLIINAFWLSWNFETLLGGIQDRLNVLDQPILLLLDLGILFACLLDQ